jgi:histidinol-phosphate aminotransferase
VSDIASRVTSAARALPSNTAYLEHLRAADADPGLIRLASNESTAPPSPAVRDALAGAYAEAHLYPPPVSRLRRRLGELHGVGVGGVLVGAGATEPIDAVLRAFAAPGDEVVLPAPSWPVYDRRLAAIGATARHVPLARAPATYAYAVDELLAAVGPRTRLVIVCTPNNPTGNTLPAADVERIARTGVPVLVDNAYVEFDAAGAAESAVELVRRFPNVLVARTFAKAYSLAGLRLGYVVCDPATGDFVERLSVPGWSVGGPALAAGLAALDDAAFARAHVAEVVAQRGRLIEALRGAGLPALDSAGNFVAIACDDVPGGSDAVVAAFLEQRILVRSMGGVARVTVGGRAVTDRVIAAIAPVAQALRRP